ncbi:Cell division cycle protein cdt2 [Talaromyces pinophilus]|nr:Cell division cycle protein cdt2 [Talaromyces pinophilus]
MERHRNVTEDPRSDPVHLFYPQDIPSSPPSIVSEAGTRRKPKRPPPVTPRSFKRFFTPRSSLNAVANVTTRQALRELNTTSLNRRGPAFTKAKTLNAPNTISHGILKSPFTEITRTPSRKRKLSFSSPTSPPQSSPIRRVRLAPPVEDDRLVEKTVNEIELKFPPEPILSPRKSIQKQLFVVKPPVEPVRRSKVLATSGEYCLRSVSGRMNRLTMRCNYGSDWRDQTSTFYSRPTDVHQNISVNEDRPALPFCIASCNTNSLVAIGDEEGGIRLVDSAKEDNVGFSKAHVSFRAHGNSIMNLEFSSDDLLLATAAGDQTTLIFDMHTQKPIHCLSNHTSSVKHVQFQPASNNKMLATCSRDGTVNIWDLRCKGHENPSMQIHCALDQDGTSSVSPPMINYPQSLRTIQDAHAFMSRTSKLAAVQKQDSHFSRENVTVTSLSFLPAGRENLFVTASEANACIRLWDMRTSYNIRRGSPAPLSTTREPDSHVNHRSYGVTSLVLNGDGSRLYSLCRDLAVYAYSTSHLVLGSSPDLALHNDRPRRAGGPDKEGLGPLYCFRHPRLQVSTFYVKAALRPAKDDKAEMLAVGSSDNCAILFPTDERFLSASQPAVQTQTDLPPTIRPPLVRPGLRRTNSDMSFSGRPESSIPTYRSGTPLVGGHMKEVSAVSWTQNGELVTVSDDYTARCWREGPDARDLRTGGETDGRRWGCGWADTPDSYDDEEE